MKKRIVEEGVCLGRNSPGCGTNDWRWRNQARMWAFTVNVLKTTMHTVCPPVCLRHPHPHPQFTSPASGRMEEKCQCASQSLWGALSPQESLIQWVWGEAVQCTFLISYPGGLVVWGPMKSVQEDKYVGWYPTCPLLWQPKMSSDISRCPLGGKTIYHWEPLG